MSIHKIYNWNELASIGVDEDFKLSDDYILMNNLDSSTTGYSTYASSDANNGRGWEPIGTSDDPFTGSFDGQGYTISDIVINRPEEDNIGLFGYLKNSNIKKIGLKNHNIEGYGYIGGIGGYHSNESKISNCYVKGFIKGTVNLGGILGYQDTSSVLSKSYSTAEVSGSAKEGGLVGYGGGIVDDSFWDIDKISISQGGTGKTAEEMKDINTYTDTSTEGLNSSWDFNGNPNDDKGNKNFWCINPYINNGYPYLINSNSDLYEYKIIYNFLATKFHLSRENKHLSSKYMKETRLFLININNQNYHIATEVIINLLYSINDSMLYDREFFHSFPYIIRTVKKINNFVTEHFDIDLTTFVNSIEWNEDCVPYNWKELSRISGYNTSQWNYCD
ncbi:MAG: GLUG motif-containing protein [bacterium]